MPVEPEVVEPDEVEEPDEVLVEGAGAGAGAEAALGAGATGVAELAWLGCKTKNQRTAKTAPRKMRVRRASRKMARGLLVTQSRASLPQHPTSGGEGRFLLSIRYINFIVVCSFQLAFY